MCGLALIELSACQTQVCLFYFIYLFFKRDGFFLLLYIKALSLPLSPSFSSLPGVTGLILISMIQLGHHPCGLMNWPSPLSYSPQMFHRITSWVFREVPSSLPSSHFMIELERSECFLSCGICPQHSVIAAEVNTNYGASRCQGVFGGVEGGRRAVAVTSHDLNLHYILIRLPSAAALTVINT